MSAKLDIITLRGLTAEGIHGVFEFEHAAPQPFVIDIALWVDTTDALTSDDIADTVSYADVANDVVSVVEGPSAHLIETLAQRISDVLLANPRVEGVEVTVHKPQAPMDQEFSDVAITVRRGNTPGTILRIRDITVVDGKVAPDADEPLVSFGGPDEATALPAVSPTSSVSLQGIEVPAQPTRYTSVVDQSVRNETRAAPRRPLPRHGVSHPFVLALGGNVGDVPVTLAEAVSHLIDIPEVQIDDVSPLLRTHAVLAPGQAAQQDHWNAVVIGHTTLSPHDLFTHTSAIEAALGRMRHEHWGPRRIDIDIISMGDLRIDDATLTIPHPRAHLRAFVLAPWALTEPDAVLAGHGRVDQLLAVAEDIHGIVDAVDDWLESPEGIQAESDILVASEASGNNAAGVSAAPSLADARMGSLEVDVSDNDSTRDRVDAVDPASPEQIRSMAGLSRPLVIPPIAVPEVAQPLAMSRLDRLDPSSKASLQPEQGADLLWHKVWNSWAQTPIDPEELTDAQSVVEAEQGPTQAQRAVEELIDDPLLDSPPGTIPASASASAEAVSVPTAPDSPASSQHSASLAPGFTPSPSTTQTGPRLNFVVSPDKPVTDSAGPSQGSGHGFAEGQPGRRPRRRVSASAEGVTGKDTQSQSTPAQPLPFQQVLVDDVVLEENPRHRPMRWAPVHSYEGASDAQKRDASGYFGARTIPHPDIPLSTPAADEAQARAELERIEAARAAETARREQAERERELQELRAREQREREARAAAIAQEQAARAEAARLEAARKAAAARAAAEREATLPPLPKRRAQFAPLRADAPRIGVGASERPLPQWDFAGTQVTIVDDSDSAVVPQHSSVLAPDLPEGTPTGAVGEAPGQTGMLSRVTMRPTATGMIPVVKRDSLHS